MLLRYVSQLETPQATARQPNPHPLRTRNETIEEPTKFQNAT